MADDDEEFDDETEESVEEWKIEASKWKGKAADAEKAALENAGAADRLAEIEKSTQAQADKHSEELAAAKAAAEEAAKAARADGEKTAAEWQTEASKWKELAQKHEQLSKKNLAAAARLEKIEAEAAASGKKAADKIAQTEAQAAEAKARAAETSAEMKAKAAAAEAKAIRLQVAQEMGIPQELVPLLVGSDKREIEQRAGEVLAAIERNKAPEPDPGPAKAEVEALAKEREELAEAKKRAVEAELKALRLEVAAEKQLPFDFAELLTADNRDDLVRQADAVLSKIGPRSSADLATRARMPVKRLRSGALPEGSGEPEPDGSAIAEAILRRNRGM